MRQLTRPLLLLCLLIPLIGYAETSDIGVIVMAHNGTPLWNQTVKNTVKEAMFPYPTRVFFGTGATREEVSQLQDDINYLENKGAHTIVAIPLLVSSFSEVYRQWGYLLGVNFNPGFINNPVFPLDKHANIQFTDPLNDDQIVALALLDRAREISQNPAQETVILVAHGPNDDADNEKWLSIMQHLCDNIQLRGHFKQVVPMTLRDEAPSEIRVQTVDALRYQVDHVSRTGGRVLVIPLLLSQGGIENQIAIALKGLDYTLNGKLLLPDHRISQWIRSKAP